MIERKKSRRNLFQNIVIVLLSVLAVVLFTRTQLYNFGSDFNDFFDLFSTDTVQGNEGVSQLIDLSTPVRIAVTGAYGRYADVAVTTGDDDFAELGTLLTEALGSADRLKPCAVADFHAALGTSQDYGSSVYYDFGSALPLPVLAGLVGADWSGEVPAARRVLLRAESAGVSLYLWDGKGACSISATALSAQTLEQTVGKYSLGSAFFAFDQGENFAALAPLSLFSEQFSPPPELTVSKTITDPGALMSALSFNPHTNSRYTESTGAEVVVEGERTLRIQPDGSVSYQSSGVALSVTAADSIPTAAEAVVGVYQLLSTLLPSSQNSATLYLQGIETNGDVSTLSFGYQSAGLPIRFSDGASAAEVTLEGAQITRLTMRIRQYTPSESPGLLLPLTQAASIARSHPDKELCAYYVDSNGATAAVQWLAE